MRYVPLSSIVLHITWVFDVRCANIDNGHFLHADLIFHSQQRQLYGHMLFATTWLNNYTRKACCSSVRFNIFFQSAWSKPVYIWEPKYWSLMPEMYVTLTGRVYWRHSIDLFTVFLFLRLKHKILEWLLCAACKTLWNISLFKSLFALYHIHEWICFCLHCILRAP